jgi:hypothetical protein
MVSTTVKLTLRALWIYKLMKAIFRQKSKNKKINAKIKIK